MTALTDTGLATGRADDPDVVATDEPSFRRLSIRDRVVRRKWPILTTLLVLATGMAFMLEWMTVYYHARVPSWITPGDLWGIFRAAHYVGWGDLGGVYTQGNGVVAFPGMEVLLAPVAMLSSSLHLTESVSGVFLPRPMAAVLLMPVELLSAGTVIFAADALAERLNVGRRRRIALCFAVAVVVWPVAALWGHAEDALALTFALYAFLALDDRRWSRCGWLFGLGIAFQPLVALLLPIFLAATPAGQRVLLLVRTAALSVFLVGVAFIGNPSGTFMAVVKQPTPFDPNHPTPWSALAPRLSVALKHPGSPVIVTHVHGHFVLRIDPSHFQTPVLVSGGAPRILDVIFALLVGVYVWRRPQDSVRLLWLTAVVLASRCFFEPVMTPYYLAPPLILALVMASRMNGKRFWAAAAIAGEVTYYSYRHLSPWRWWLPIVAGLVGVLALGYVHVRSSNDLEQVEGSSSADQIELDAEPEVEANVDAPPGVLEPAH